MRALAVLAPGDDRVYFVEQGRSYYALPAMALPLAAGSVSAVAGSAGPGAALAVVTPVVALHAVVVALLAPVVWPVLSERTMVERGVWRDSFYKDEIGWPELADGPPERGARSRRPSAATRPCSPRTTARPGRSRCSARAQGLPTPLSGHLSFQYWHPARLPQHHVLAVGVDDGQLDRLCTCLAHRGAHRQPLAPRQRGAGTHDRALHAARHARRALVVADRDDQL